MTQTALCPSCDGDISLSDSVKLHMKLVCPRCGEPLVVIETKPLEFDFEYDDIDEDDDDFEYDDDDDDDDEDEEED